MSTAHTPGWLELRRKIKEDPENVYKYTNKSNIVAVVSDGSAVLGLGNIGGLASIPVMDGKSLLFKELRASTHSRSVWKRRMWMRS